VFMIQKWTYVPKLPSVYDAKWIYISKILFRHVITNINVLPFRHSI
ncbi:20416_t:CDS:1, partial [Gigaspora rosea]